jgi:TPR repeat protein
MVVLLTFTISVCIADLATADQLEDGIAAVKGGKSQTAMTLLTPLAINGNAVAQLYIGWLHATGTPANYVEATRWYRRSAEQGNAAAQFSFGWMYANGQGVEQNYITAIDWYERAAQQGHAPALENLGHVYFLGQGVSQDYGKAVTFYRLGAQLGDARSQLSLSMMYAENRGVSQDYLSAHMWAAIASESSDREMARASTNAKEILSKSMTAPQVAAAEEMARNCTETNYKRCEVVSPKPVSPWPPVRILDRAAEAECKIEELVVEGETRAAERSGKAAAEKGREIEGQAGIATNANEKRKGGSNFEIETGMKRTGFSLDLPEVQVSYGPTRIPTVHVKVDTTKVTILVMGQCSVGSMDIPEFRGLDITMVTHTIYVPCPKQTDVVLTLPQFTAGETTINVPQVTTRMVRKDVVFHVPQFTYRDWEKVAHDAEEKLEAEKVLLQRALTEIKRGEGARTSEAIRQTLKKLKEKAEAEINAARSDAMKDVDASRKALEKARNEARRAIEGAGGIWDESRWGLANLERGFAGYGSALLKPYDDAQVKINSLFDGLVKKYLGHAIYSLGTAAPFCGARPKGIPSTGLQQ